MKQLLARIEDVSNRDKGVQICFILKLGSCNADVQAGTNYHNDG